jgi:hypothetical protein
MTKSASTCDSPAQVHLLFRPLVHGAESLPSAGMWGTGVYFATNASYSNGYAYPSDAKTRQFFLAQVVSLSILLGQALSPSVAAAAGR